MNKKVIAVIVLTIIALVILTLFSFGPFAGTNQMYVKDPASLRPQTTEQLAVSQQKITFSVYHNKDMKENFYTFKVPDNWDLTSGQTAGSFETTFAAGNGKIQLQDVPDNSTLELFILSQEEPLLTKTLKGYKRIDYRKTTINGNEAYQLTYQYSDNDAVKKNLSTYITGPDRAAFTSFSTNLEAFGQFSPMFTIINNSFNWENN